MGDILSLFLTLQTNKWFPVKHFLLLVLTKNFIKIGILGANNPDHFLIEPWNVPERLKNLYVNNDSNC